MLSCQLTAECDFIGHQTTPDLTAKAIGSGTDARGVRCSARLSRPTLDPTNSASGPARSPRASGSAGNKGTKEIGEEALAQRRVTPGEHCPRHSPPAHA